MVSTTSHRSWAALLGMAAGVTAFGLVGSAVHASAIASDNAGNYTASLSTGSTGGTGFGSWTVLASNNGSTSYAGTYLDTSGQAIAVAPSKNTWGVYANSGTASNTPTPRIDLFRPFTGALASGQTFSAAMDSGNVGSDVYGTPPTYHGDGIPALGFSLQTGSAATVTAGTTPMTVGSSSYSTGSFTNPNAVFTFSLTTLAVGETLNGQKYSGASGSYGMETNITDATGTHSTLSGLTGPQIAAGVTAAFSLGSASTYTLTLSSVGATPKVLDTYTGTVSSTSPINGVDLFGQATGSNGYFNSLQVTAVPEPATMGLFLAAGAGLLLVRRRRAV